MVYRKRELTDHMSTKPQPEQKVKWEAIEALLEREGTWAHVYDTLADLGMEPSSLDLSVADIILDLLGVPKDTSADFDPEDMMDDPVPGGFFCRDWYKEIIEEYLSSGENNFWPYAEQIIANSPRQDPVTPQDG